MINLTEKEPTTEKKTYKIGGMHCAMCAKTIEKVVKSISGVKDAVVNLSSEKLTVDLDSSTINNEEIKHAVENAGYKFYGEEDVKKTLVDFLMRTFSKLN